MKQPLREVLNRSSESYRYEPPDRQKGRLARPPKAEFIVLNSDSDSHQHQAVCKRRARFQRVGIQNLVRVTKNCECVTVQRSMFALVTSYLLELHSTIEALALARGGESLLLRQRLLVSARQVAGAAPTYISDRLHEARKTLTTLKTRFEGRQFCP